MERKVIVAAIVAAVMVWGARLPGNAQTEDVGHFSQVINDVKCKKQGAGPTLQVKVQDGVANQDVVRTEERSRAMMRFIDETTMTVGPQTELTVEDYMYDATKGKRQAVVQLYKGVVETVAPRVISTDKPDFIIKTPTATAGIRGTKYYTVVGPNFTAFYVTEGTIRVRSHDPKLETNSPVMKLIAEGLKKRQPVAVILDQALAAGFEPCELIKAALIQGIPLEQVTKFFMAKSQTDPRFREGATFTIMKCAVEALRYTKEEDVSAGKYAILMQNLAPIVGLLKPGDSEKVSQLTVTGIPENMNIPNFPPSETAIAEASLPEAVQTVATALVAAGANPVEVAAYTSILTYAPPAEAPGAEAPAVSPTVSPSFPGQGVEENPEPTTSSN